MQISGHRTRSIFDRYDVTDGADLRAAVERMDQLPVVSAVATERNSKTVFRCVRLIKPQRCAEPGCSSNAHFATQFYDGELRPGCSGHVPMQFAQVIIEALKIESDERLHAAG